MLSFLRIALAGAAMLALTAAAPLPAQLGSDVTVTLAGGPHAGTYSLTSKETCEFQDWMKEEPPRFIGSFQTWIGPNSKRKLEPSEIAEVSLIVPDVRAPKPGVLMLGVTFGDLTNRKNPGTFYLVNTVPLEMRNDIEREMMGGKIVAGRGDVKIDRQGDKATVTFWGVTQEGVRIDGVIQCPKIRSY